MRLIESVKDYYSIPGKVFLLGEYAVLAGLPAIIVTVDPPFTLFLSEEDHEKVPHPKSPAGLLRSWIGAAGRSTLSFKFEDPLQGRGGFGASTAEFAMEYLAYSNQTNNSDLSWKTVWKLYRELTKDEAVPPSGADLIAQWQGGVVLIDPLQEQCEDLTQILDWSRLLIFSATSQKGRKVATHEHLAKLSNLDLPSGHSSLVTALDSLIKEGILAIRSCDFEQLGRTMNQYGDTLQAFGFEVPATSEDRKFLRNLPGVLGIKGAGALQSDAILILTNPKIKNDQQIIHQAQKRGLELLNDGITQVPGIFFHPSSSK